MDLKKWIEGNKKDYALGVAIFESYGGSPTLLRLFKKSESSFNKEKLKAQLEEIYNKQVFPADPNTFKTNGIWPSKTPPKTVRSEPTLPSIQKEIPAELKIIYDLKLSSYKKSSAIHQQLSTIKGKSDAANESRLKLVIQIMQLDELNEQCWDKIYYYEKHGKLPLDESGFYPEQLTIRELVQLEKAIPTYITKLSKDANNTELSDAQRQKFYDRKAEWHLKQQRIKQELDALPVLSKIKEALC